MAKKKRHRKRREKRDPAQLDVFEMKPRGKPGPKTIVFRDKKGRFTEVMRIDEDVELGNTNSLSNRGGKMKVTRKWRYNRKIKKWVLIECVENRKPPCRIIKVSNKKS